MTAFQLPLRVVQYAHNIYHTYRSLFSVYLTYHCTIWCSYTDTLPSTHTPSLEVAHPH